MVIPPRFWWASEVEPRPQGVQNADTQCAAERRQNYRLGLKSLEPSAGTQSKLDDEYEAAKEMSGQ